MTYALPLPKYHQIYLVLREQLQDGRYDGRLPSELQLVREFGVARVTVRKALERLAAEGLIRRAPGRGTTRVPPAARRARAAETGTPRMNGLLRKLVDMGCSTSVRVVEVSIAAAPDAVACALELTFSERVQKAVRVRSTREGPLSHITTYVPEHVAQVFDPAALARKPLLTLLEEGGIALGDAFQVISARLADSIVAEQLQLPVGSALLSVTRLVRDTAGRPVQWLQGLYRPDRYQYEMHLGSTRSIEAHISVSGQLADPFAFTTQEISHAHGTFDSPPDA